LRAGLSAKVRAALPRMAEWKILMRDGEHYRLSGRRRHPQFPFVDDIIEFQKNFLEETLANEAYAPALASERIRIRQGEIAPTIDRLL
jgi:capsule polysaccharide export protein KpsE/RkpR